MEDCCFVPKKSLIALSDLGLFSPVLPGCPEGWAEDRKPSITVSIVSTSTLRWEWCLGECLIPFGSLRSEKWQTDIWCVHRSIMCWDRNSRIKHDPNVYIKHRTPFSMLLVTKGHLFGLRDFKIQLVNHLGLKIGFNSSSCLDQEGNLLTYMYKIQVSFSLKAPRVYHSLPFPFCLNVTRLAFALSSPLWWQDSLNYSSSTLFIIESSRKVSLTLIQVWIKVLGLTVTGSDWVPFLTLMEFTCSTFQAGLGIREGLVSPGKDTRHRHQELNRCWVARTAGVYHWGTGLIQEEKKNNMTLNS